MLGLRHLYDDACYDTDIDANSTHEVVANVAADENDAKMKTLNVARHLAFVANDAHCVACDLLSEQSLPVLLMLMLLMSPMATLGILSLDDNDGDM
jgi:hypothetical protein